MCPYLQKSLNHSTLSLDQRKLEFSYVIFPPNTTVAIYTDTVKQRTRGIFYYRFASIFTVDILPVIQNDV